MATVFWTRPGCWPWRQSRGLCVIGGGYIGLELGTALAKLGSKVTIVEAADDLASGFGADAARLVRVRSSVGAT